MLSRIVTMFLFTFSLQAAPIQPTPPPPPSASEAVAVEPKDFEIPHLHTDIPSSSKDNESYEHAFIKMILTLGGLLVLVFLTLWLLRKFSHGRIGGFGSTKRIKVLEKKPLSPKTILYLIELDGNQVFIAESQLEIKTLLTPHLEMEE